jgi:hypothetical protein
MSTENEPLSDGFLARMELFQRLHWLEGQASSMSSLAC